MAIDGRINVDVLFHDTDGTTSLKVVSLEDSTAYTSGKVAIVTGTVGTAVASIPVSSTTYKNAAGATVSFAAVQRFAISATGSPVRVQQDYVLVECAAGRACISDGNGADDDFVAYTTAGTASYTLVLYGT